MMPYLFKTTISSYITAMKALLRPSLLIFSVLGMISSANAGGIVLYESFIAKPGYKGIAQPQNYSQQQTPLEKFIAGKIDLQQYQASGANSQSSGTGSKSFLYGTPAYKHFALPEPNWGKSYLK